MQEMQQVVLTETFLVCSFYVCQSQLRVLVKKWNKKGMGIFADEKNIALFFSLKEVFPKYKQVFEPMIAENQIKHELKQDLINAFSLWDNFMAQPSIQSTIEFQQTIRENQNQE